MELVNILIVLLFVVVVYLLFFNTNSTENFEVLDAKVIGTSEYYKQLCDKTTSSNTDVKKYLADNCTEEVMDEKKNFRGAINNRSWCRIKGEEEITSDINKDTWCNLVSVEQMPMEIGTNEL
jgi:hypothetical protein